MSGPPSDDDSTQSSTVSRGIGRLQTANNLGMATGGRGGPAPPQPATRGQCLNRQHAVKTRREPSNQQDTTDNAKLLPVCDHSHLPPIPSPESASSVLAHTSNCPTSLEIVSLTDNARVVRASRPLYAVHPGHSAPPGPESLPAGPDHGVSAAPTIRPANHRDCVVVFINRPSDAPGVERRKDFVKIYETLHRLSPVRRMFDMIDLRVSHLRISTRSVTLGRVCK